MCEVGQALNKLAREQMKLFLTLVTFIVFSPLILIWFISDIYHTIQIPPNKRLP